MDSPWFAKLITPQQCSVSFLSAEALLLPGLIALPTYPLGEDHEIPNYPHFHSDGNQCAG